MNAISTLWSLHRRALLAAALLLLTACASTAAPGAAPAAEPGGESLTLLYWQAVSIMNPYLATGTKDYHAASLVLEPLFSFDPSGAPAPRLVEEIPTVENGGVAANLTSITWRLKPGILWSDGTPMTAGDVVFTWQYCTHPDTGCSLVASFSGVSAVEALDDLTVRVTFTDPTAYPYTAFGGYMAPILQRAQFAGCVGAAAQGCAEQNTHPIGTGPYVVADFRANDAVTFAANPHYREEDKPYFSRVILKGGGDAASAARAVLETAEADYAWNVQVEPQLLADMLAAGNGRLETAFAGKVERILLNFTNPDPALGSRRSEWSAADPNPHPILSDVRVRRALSLALDRQIIAEQLYGTSAAPTCNMLAGPPEVVSSANDACLTQDIAAANALLEEAGWRDEDGDDVREKDGLRLRLTFAAPTGSVRQKTQALIKQWWGMIGVEVELKNVDSAVYFGGDPASPDTYTKFYADVEVLTNGPDTPDPISYFSLWTCRSGENIARAENQWLGNNVERWCSAEYDALYDRFLAATGAAQRAALAKQLNDLLVQEVVSIPLLFRGSTSAVADGLQGVQLNGWDSEEWNIADWRRAD